MPSQITRYGEGNVNKDISDMIVRLLYGIFPTPEYNITETKYIVVDAGGNGDFTTVQAAFTWLGTNSGGANWTMLIRDGTYAEHVATTGGYGLTIIGLGAVTISGDDSTWLMGSISNSSVPTPFEIRNITLDQTSSGGGTSLLGVGNGEAWTFRDCTLKPFQRTLFEGNGSATLYHCTIGDPARDYTTEGLVDGHGASTVTATLYDCLIVGQTIGAVGLVRAYTLIGCRIVNYSTGNVLQNTGGGITVGGCKYDTSKTTGTIIRLDGDLPAITIVNATGAIDWTLNSAAGQEVALIFNSGGVGGWALYKPAGTTDLRVYDYAAAADKLTVVMGGNITLNLGNFVVKPATTAGIALDPNAATGNFTGSLSPANLLANRRWTFKDADGTVAFVSDIVAGSIPLTRGSLLVGNASNVAAPVAVGTSGAFLTNDGTDTAWSLGLLSVASGKTLTVSNSLTLAGSSDGLTLTVPGTGTAALLNQANSFTLINPLTTIAESWIGPSSTTGIYFKGGNVGIGTTSPDQKLTVAGDIGLGTSYTTNGVTPGLYFWNDGTRTTTRYARISGTTGAYSDQVGLSFDVSTADGNFKTGAMVLTKDGNVGIATANPMYPLEIAGGGNSVGARVTGTATGANWSGRVVAGGPSNVFLFGQYNDHAWLGAHNAALNAWANFYINPDGGTKVFIGAYPSTENTILTIDNATGNSYFINGNVGIATTLAGAYPTYQKLNVLGGILLTGNSSTPTEESLWQVVPALGGTGTHADYTSNSIVKAGSSAGLLEVMQFGNNKTAAMLGVLGAAAIARPAAMTTQLTTLTCSAPGTPDYAIADPVQNTGYGFSTADEFLSLVKAVANQQTRLAELETNLGHTSGFGFLTK